MSAPRVQVVTTFSKEGQAVYGNRFVQSWLRNCDTHLVVYHESAPAVDAIAPNLEWRNLDHDEHRNRFLAKWGKDQDKIGHLSDPNAQAIRFCHKVFALANAAERSHAEWLVWMDADVILHAAPDWQDLLPDSADVVYLGRENAGQWKLRNGVRKICSETGFVAYRISDRKVFSLIADMRAYYNTGEIFTRPKTDWHDAKAFDIARERSGIPPERQLSLSKDVPGTHVWPLTKLARFSTHVKGPGRKMGVYGGIAP